MLLRLQRHMYDLVYKPGCQVILDDTLSRAYLSSQSNAVGSEFPAEIASLMDEQQVVDLTLLAPGNTIRSLVYAAELDDDYQQLLKQMKSGWPSSPAELDPAVRPYASFADELAISGDLVFKGHRVIIPLPPRDDILCRIHSSHININGCIRRAQENVQTSSQSLGNWYQVTTSALDIKRNHGRSHCLHTQLYPDHGKV